MGFGTDPSKVDFDIDDVGDLNQVDAVGEEDPEKELTNVDGEA